MRRSLSYAGLTSGVLSSLLLAGCSASGNTGAPPIIGRSAARPVSYTYTPSRAHVPACAGAGRAIALPQGFPATFPMPPGTAITARQYYRGDRRRIVVSGVAPITVRSGLIFFQSTLPAAGFRLGQGDSEAAEAESLYKGHGYLGRWKLHAIDGCTTAVILLIYAQPA